MILLAACSPGEETPPEVVEVELENEAATDEQVSTEQPELAEYAIELDYDLGGWPEAPLPTAQPPFNGICYVAFNTEKEPFDDVLVRRAFAYSLDREYIAQNATCDSCSFFNQRPAITLVPEDFYTLKSGADLYSQWVSHEIPGLEEASDFYQKWLDDQWVRDLLLEGYVPEELSIELITSDCYSPIAELVSQNWQDYLAVDVEWASMDINSFLSAVAGAEPPHAYLTCNYMDLDDPSDLLIGLISGHYGNFIRWDVPDAYYQAAFAGYENDDMNAYLMAESMLVGEYAVIAPLFYYQVE